MGRPEGSGRKGEIRYLNEQELTRFMKEAKKDKMYDLAFSLALSLGLRVAELVKIQLSDFSDDRKTLHVKAVKGGREYKHELSGKMWRKYLRWLHVRGSNNNPFLFPSRLYHDDHCSRDAFQQAFKKICKKANITGHSVHDLRHTCAVSLVLEGKLSIAEIRDRLRHSSVSSTEVYFNLLNREKAERTANDYFDQYL